MRIGLIGRADSTGLGTQSKEFFNHIPCKVLVIDSSPMLPSLQLLKPNLDWYPGQRVFPLRPGLGMTGMFSKSIIDEFISDIDILFAMETPYDYNIFTACRERGIKTVLQLNYEFLDFPSNLPKPDLFAAPSLWNFDSIPNPKVFLPVPVNTKKFSQHRKPKTFVHIAGRPAIHDRNGTQTFFSALKHVKNEIEVVVKSQIPIRANGECPPNVRITIDHSNKENYYDNYTGGVAVLPRKYGGLCLPINESIAAGMPVITTDISPNNKWLPKDWLVKANHAGTLRSKKTVDFYEADALALAAKIDEFCNEQFYNKAVDECSEIANHISWDALHPLYMVTFSQVLHS